MKKSTKKKKSIARKKSPARKKSTAMKKFSVCGNVDWVSAGETFRFVNHRDEDCVATGCRPPLEQHEYLVPAQNHADAKVDDDALPTSPTNNYDYQCDCSRKDTDPKIIIR
jgi:hypothetical protein